MIRWREFAAAILPIGVFSMAYGLKRLAATFYVLAVLLPVAAAAAEIETAKMTWIEIRDAIAADKTTIVIPTGGTEQNGPHMVTGKHNAIVAVSARRVAEELGNALVAPVLNYTPEGDIASREGHMAFAGTLSIRPEIYEGVLEDIARSFQVAGFRAIVFLGDSGPNQAPQDRVADKLSGEWQGNGSIVINAKDYYATPRALEYLTSKGLSAEAIGVHAGVRDTSELMAVDPDGVRLDKRAAGGEGANGDARLATAELGKTLLDIRIAAAIAQIRARRQTPPAKQEEGWTGWFSKPSGK